MFTQKAGVPFMIALQIRVKGECIFLQKDNNSNVSNK